MPVAYLEKNAISARVRLSLQAFERKHGRRRDCAFTAVITPESAPAAYLVLCDHGHKGYLPLSILGAWPLKEAYDVADHLNDAIGLTLDQAVEIVRSTF